MFFHVEISCCCFFVVVVFAYPIHASKVQSHLERHAAKVVVFRDIVWKLMVEGLDPKRIMALETRNKHHETTLVCGHSKGKCSCCLGKFQIPLIHNAFFTTYS